MQVIEEIREVRWSRGAAARRAASCRKAGSRPGRRASVKTATSVNPVDVKTRKTGRAIAPDLPAVLGTDIAGTIDAVGVGVDGVPPPVTRSGAAAAGCVA